MSLQRRGYPAREVGQWAYSEAQAIHLAKREYRRRMGLVDGTHVEATAWESSPRRSVLSPALEQEAVIQHELMW